MSTLPTTHSLDFIDSLLAQLSDEEVAGAGFMTVIRTRLDNGLLLTTPIEARVAEERRNEIQEDLR
jgi:hypothetical protein